MNREQVYEAIDSERDYQESRWNGSQHSFEEWITPEKQRHCCLGTGAMRLKYKFQI